MYEFDSDVTPDKGALEKLAASRTKHPLLYPKPKFNPNLPVQDAPPSEEERAEDHRRQCLAFIEKVGAFEAFTWMRDETISRTQRVQETVRATEETRDLTSEEQKFIVCLANELRNSLINFQNLVDSAFAFEKIESGTGLQKN